MMSDFVVLSKVLSREARVKDDGNHLLNSNFSYATFRLQI
jgi:hypothetical protein